MMKRRLTFLIYLILTTVLLLGNDIVTVQAIDKDKQKDTTIYIAYTCNTWGQLQPCPS